MLPYLLKADFDQLISNCIADSIGLVMIDSWPLSTCNIWKAMQRPSASRASLEIESDEMDAL